MVLGVACLITWPWRKSSKKFPGLVLVVVMPPVVPADALHPAGMPFPAAGREGPKRAGSSQFEVKDGRLRGGAGQNHSSICFTELAIVTVRLAWMRWSLSTILPS